MSDGAEQLLDSVLEGSEVSHLVDPTLEEHIVIGEDRVVKVPQMLKRIAVQYDHNIETVTFDCPRYWDGIDMSTMKVYINYLNANSNRGMYHADDVTIDESNDSIMHFTWTISREVTSYKGTISFLVCIRNVDDDGFESNHWNSELNRDMTVSEGLECEESIIQSYPDIITQLLMRMDRIGVSLAFEDDGNGNVAISGVNNLNNFCEKYDERITYGTGDYCMYLGVLYRCIYPVTEPELFDFNKWADTCITDEVLQCFQNVDDGKTLIAAAITDMDVPTAATETFEQMADNIRTIIMCPEGSTAEEAHVLEGKKFITSDKQVRTGTMINHHNSHGAETIMVDAGQIIKLEPGYYDETTKFVGASLNMQTPGTAISENILAGKTAWVNGEKIEGTMVNYSNGGRFETMILDPGQIIKLEPGYYDETNIFTAIPLNMLTLADATAADIRTGKTAWVNGEKLTGTMVADGVILYDANGFGLRYVDGGDNHNYSTYISYTAESDTTIKIHVKACMDVSVGSNHNVYATIRKNDETLEVVGESMIQWNAGNPVGVNDNYKRYETTVDVVAGDVIRVDYSYIYDSGAARVAYNVFNSLIINQMI